MDLSGRQIQTALNNCRTTGKNKTKKRGIEYRPVTSRLSRYNTTFRDEELTGSLGKNNTFPDETVEEWYERTRELINTYSVTFESEETTNGTGTTVNAQNTHRKLR